MSASALRLALALLASVVGASRLGNLTQQRISSGVQTWLGDPAPAAGEAMTEIHLSSYYQLCGGVQK